jgi:alkylated DNA repair dioxygenase AlkB
VPASNETLDLFAETGLPEGMEYQPDFLSAEGERALLRSPSRSLNFTASPVSAGRSRSAGADFNGGGLGRTEDMPEFLIKLRAQAEAFAGIAPGSFQQVLVTEHAPGAGIGWHKDRSVFGDVAGISLLSSCTFRLRRRTGKGFERKNLIAGPRSVYLLRGPSRTEWEPSIPNVESLRYSITFRSVLERSAP